MLAFKHAQKRREKYQVKTIGENGVVKSGKKVETVETTGFQTAKLQHIFCFYYKILIFGTGRQYFIQIRLYEPLSHKFL